MLAVGPDASRCRIVAVIDEVEDVLGWGYVVESAASSNDSAS